MKIRIFLQNFFLPIVAHGTMPTMWSMTPICPAVAFARSGAACLTSSRCLQIIPDVLGGLLDVQGSFCGLLGGHGSLFDVPVPYAAFIRPRPRLISNFEYK